MSFLNWLFGNDDDDAPITSDDAAPLILPDTNDYVHGAVPLMDPNLGRGYDKNEVIYYSDMTPEQKAEYGFVKVNPDQFPKR